MKPELDYLVVLATLKSGKIHQVLLRDETRDDIANFIAQREGSIRLVEEPMEGIETTYKRLPDITGLTRDQVVLLYIDLILSDAPQDRVVNFNQMILSKWSNSALIYIKEKSWREIWKVRPDLKP